MISLPRGCQGGRSACHAGPALWPLMICAQVTAKAAAGAAAAAASVGGRPYDRSMSVRTAQPQNGEQHEPHEAGEFVAQQSGVGTSTLDTKVANIVGGRTANALTKAFGIVIVADLLAHYPRRYAKRGELTALSELPLGESVTIMAEVLEVRKRTMQKRKGSIIEVKISDGSGILLLTFFNQPWRENELRVGERGMFAGKITDFRGTLQLAHPNFKILEVERLSGEGEDAAAAKRWAESPIPIYPATSALTSWDIQKTIGIVLDSLGPIPEPIPNDVRRKRHLLRHGEALDRVHRPRTDADWRQARDTLRYTEALVLQTALVQQKIRARATPTMPRVALPGGLLERFDAALPFRLTDDQVTVGNEIARDLAEPAPMNRLVQGEVGSGKTLVALRAMLAVADSGGQSALLAPTEVLAAQHLRSIVKVLGPELAAELVPTLLTGQMPVAQKRKSTLRAVSGQARIVVGTHALIADSVAFYDLGLVVVDEQHRFGVEQRDALRKKADTPPHVLVLTATPIPRTVAMTVFGDLEISTITQLPAGRQGIESFVVPLGEKPAWASRVWSRTAEELALGRQVFVVCPAIDAKRSEELPDDVAAAGGAEDGTEDPNDPATHSRAPESVESVMEMLANRPELKGSTIAALHGRIPSDEKDRIMLAFSAGIIDVLVATTVIEVGVDVPNASTMVIMNAERFGVSQLHQLRGRVGRGGIPGLCLLVTWAEEGSIARERVDAVAATIDGFELAQIDLELRREGDVLGARQSGGRSSLRLLRVAFDGDIIAEAREVASELLREDPGLRLAEGLSDALRRRLDEAERAFLSKN